VQGETGFYPSHISVEHYVNEEDKLLRTICSRAASCSRSASRDTFHFDVLATPLASVTSGPALVDEQDESSLLCLSLPTALFNNVPTTRDSTTN
jgi:hypothetical protein